MLKVSQIVRSLWNLESLFWNLWVDPNKSISLKMFELWIFLVMDQHGHIHFLKWNYVSGITPENDLHFFSCLTAHPKAGGCAGWSGTIMATAASSSNAKPWARPEALQWDSSTLHWLFCWWRLETLHVGPFGPTQCSGSGGAEQSVD